MMTKEERDHPAIKRDRLLRVMLITALVMVFGTIMFVSRAPLTMTDRPWVAQVAPLPAAADRARLTALLDAYAIYATKVQRRGVADFFDRPVTQARPPLAIGYSMRELTAFGMPFGAYRDIGYVVYRDTGPAFEMLAPLEQARASFEQQFRVDLAPGGLPPTWQHYWGWSFILALLGYGLFEMRAARRRREALGLI